MSNQPQYSMLWRVIEAEVVHASRGLGVCQIVSAIDEALEPVVERDPARTQSPATRPVG